MKVAIVHDYLTEYGGAERVLEALHELWPDAPVFTMVADVSSLGPHKERFANWDIRQTGARLLPFWKQLKSGYRLLAPLFWETLNFDGYDVVISSTSSYFSKGILTKPETLHISYIHTPPRFLWGYPSGSNWRQQWWSQLFGLATNPFLRQYDVVASQRPDVLVANSTEVARRIKRLYGRDAEVVYPPVDVEKFSEPPFAKAEDEEPFFLVVSRLTFAKHVDIAIRAAEKADVRLKIVGRGSEEKRLRRLAGVSVTFLGEISDDRLRALVQACTAVLFASEDEDFGMTPVESMLCGTPVVAYYGGGYKESVVEGKSGVFF
ncbi:MAG: glycosyltransferase, partial [bacterium]|nr:glycosyltransferase [bacterium]